MAKADIVVNEPRTPVAKTAIAPSLNAVPAAIAPKIEPSNSEPRRFIPAVAYGPESGSNELCIEYLSEAPMAPPTATNANSRISMHPHRHMTFDFF